MWQLGRRSGILNRAVSFRRPEALVPPDMAPGTGQPLLLQRGRKGVIPLQLQCGAGLVRWNARRRRQKGALPLKNRGVAACIHALFLLLGERGMATVAAERRLGIVMD